jgi:hypothetical protein
MNLSDTTEVRSKLRPITFSAASSWKNEWIQTKPESFNLTNVLKLALGKLHAIKRCLEPLLEPFDGGAE